MKLLSVHVHLNEFLQNAQLKEENKVVPNDRTMIKNLLEDHEAIIRFMRSKADICAQEYHDPASYDFLADLLEDHEKMAWMLRSYLQE